MTILNNSRMVKGLLFLFSISFIAAACNVHPTHLMQEKVLTIKAHKYTVQLADTPDGRDKGLGGIKQIGEEEGMLFLFSEPQMPSFWMKDMLFPIDIVWINGDRIVDITDNVKPMPDTPVVQLPIYKPSVAADKVLEVNA